jgi:hypothetical protein
MSPDFLQAAIVFATSFCSLLLVWTIKGVKRNKNEEAMLLALNRVRGINPRKATRALTPKQYARVIRSGV